MDIKDKILVIGSKNHKFAESVGWQDKIPYLGDYDLVIINLNTLNESKLNDLIKILPAKRTELNDAIWHDTRVICITAPTISIENTTNYDWCPIQIFYQEQKGKSFQAGKPKKGYFGLVKEWSHYYVGSISSNYKLKNNEKFSVRINPSLSNKAGKALGLTLFIHEYGTYGVGKNSQTIRFLPPPTECSIKEGIDFLILDLFNIDSSVPVWANSINVCNEDENISIIDDSLEQIESLNGKIIEQKEEIEKISKFKRLLYEGGEGKPGENLEKIVEESMELLGITYKPSTNNEEDGNITDPISGESIPVEVGGMIKSIPEHKLVQLLKWVTLKDTQNQNIKCRGLLIGNPYQKIALDEHLEGRERPAEPNVIKKAEVFNTCVLPTVELFKAVQFKLQGGDISDFINKIFNTTGLLEFK